MSRAFVLTVVVIFAAAGVASSASAAECKKEASKKYALCTGSSNTLTEGTFKVHISWGSTVYHINSAGIRVHCDESLLTTAPVLSASLGSVKITQIMWHFTGCSVGTPAHCTIQSELIKWLGVEGLWFKAARTLYFPEAGTELTTITFLSSGGTCLVAGKLKLSAEKGKAEEGPECEIASSETSAVVHLVACAGGATSHLKLGAEAAEFTGDFNNELESGEPWAVIEGK